MSREDDDFRGRRKKVVTNSADAEAWIRAQREARREFEAGEGRSLYTHDAEMDRLQAEHADIGAREEQRQREFVEKRREDDTQREVLEQLQESGSEQQREQQEQEQGRSM